MKPVIGVLPQYNVENHQIKVERVYFESVQKAGGIPVLLPLHNEADDLADLVMRLDGILFTGGPDVNPMYFNEEAIPECGMIVPERDELELAILPVIMREKLPILGICRGIQSLNIALGGDIYQDLGVQFQQQGKLRIAHSQNSGRATKTHKVTINDATMLTNIIGAKEIWVNSFHHQSVRRLAPGLTVAATSSDGLIEAFTKEDYPFLLGVQWHPEELSATDEYARRIFSHFIAAARTASQR